MTGSIELPEVQGLLASWWYDYDEANFERWADYFTADARYQSRSDSGISKYEDVVRADYVGRNRLLEDLGRHRAAGIYPIRHFCSNVHLVAVRDTEAEFRNYLLVTQVSGEHATPIASGRCSGSVRRLEGALQIAEMKLVFDLRESRPLESGPARSVSRDG